MAKVVPVFKATISNGKIKMLQKELFEVYLKQFQEEQEIKVVVSKYYKPRSLNQNSYMWGVVYSLIANELGYTTEEIHDLMRIEHLTDRTGKYPRVKSTSELSTIEMEDYLSKCRTWASAELGVYIPLPNEAVQM